MSLLSGIFLFYFFFPFFYFFFGSFTPTTKAFIWLFAVYSEHLFVRSLLSFLLIFNFLFKTSWQSVVHSLYIMYFIFFFLYVYQRCDTIWSNFTILLLCCVKQAKVNSKKKRNICGFFGIILFFIVLYRHS